MHECALKLTDLWNTIASLLFDLNYKFQLTGASLLALAKSMYYLRDRSLFMWGGGGREKSWGGPKENFTMIGGGSLCVL